MRLIIIGPADGVLVAAGDQASLPGTSNPLLRGHALAFGNCEVGLLFSRQAPEVWATILEAHGDDAAKILFYVLVACAQQTARPSPAGIRVVGPRSYLGSVP
jgi:hypothetical protein